MCDTNNCRSCQNAVHLVVKDHTPTGNLKLLEQTMCGVCWKPISEFLPPSVKPVMNICGHVFHPSCLVPPRFYPTLVRCPLCGHLIQETRSLHITRSGLDREISNTRTTSSNHTDDGSKSGKATRFNKKKEKPEEGPVTCGNNRATLDVD